MQGKKKRKKEERVPILHLYKPKSLLFDNGKKAQAPKHACGKILMNAVPKDMARYSSFPSPRREAGLADSDRRDCSSRAQEKRRQQKTWQKRLNLSRGDTDAKLSTQSCRQAPADF